MGTFVASLIIVALPAAAPGQGPVRELASPTCHIHFRYPSDWAVAPDTLNSALPCAFRLRPLDWSQRLLRTDSVDVATISLRVVAQGVWTAAARHGFRRTRRAWVIGGRQGLQSPAHTIRGANWEGLRGIAEVGCFREGEDAHYVGLCSAPTIVIGGLLRAVVIRGGRDSEPTMERLLSGLRIEP